VDELELDGIGKRFGDVAALADVDLTVAKGELFTLLGPSGCGKTTLLRTVAGFEREDAGEVRLGGRSLRGVPPHERDASLVFQSYALFPHLTVRENVAFGLVSRRRPADEVRRRVDELLATVRMSALAERTPDQLSGGQQQRVGIARALAVAPRLLLMDEPLSNLDAKLRVEMRAEVRALQRSLGITTLYVTHDQEEALAISDRIAVLRDGRVQQVGTPWAVYTEPANAFVAAFVGRMSLVAGAEAPDALWADVAPAVPPAERADLRVGVRPEDLLLEAGADGPGLAGVVVSRTFTGAAVGYALDCGGLRLEAQRSRPRAGRLLEPGAPIRARIAPGAAYLFASDGARRGPA